MLAAQFANFPRLFSMQFLWTLVKWKCWKYFLTEWTSKKTGSWSSVNDLLYLLANLPSSWLTQTYLLQGTVCCLIVSPVQDLSPGWGYSLWWQLWALCRYKFQLQWTSLTEMVISPTSRVGSRFDWLRLHWLDWCELPSFLKDLLIGLSRVGLVVQ